MLVKGGPVTLLNIRGTRLNNHEYLWCVLVRCWKLHRHDDVIKWKHFSRYWPFLRGIHRSRVNSLAQRPVTRSFLVIFDLCRNKRLSKQSHPFWRHRNGVRCIYTYIYIYIYIFIGKWTVLSWLIVTCQLPVWGTRTWLPLSLWVFSCLMWPCDHDVNRHMDTTNNIVIYL